ncbi:MAG: hypothetical protein E7557_04175 [Ruminococcaceae bacterium]|nr:hypothetical protein [Oscillospiraceae bacterium]
MAVCPVCGCKTDELDFVLSKIEDTEVKVCSFCDKQIKKINTDEVTAPAQVRWLESVASKDIPREPQIAKVIDSLKSKYLPESEKSEAPAAIANQFAEIKREVNIPQSQAGGSANISVDQYNSLVKRLEKIENSFKKYKKAQLIKMIIELSVPVIMVFVLLIIFFSSGLYDLLSTLAP